MDKVKIILGKISFIDEPLYLAIEKKKLIFFSSSRRSTLVLDFSGRRRSCWFDILYVFLGENQVQEEPMEVKLIDQDPVKE